VPHLPENGKVVSFGPNSPTVTNIASGAPLLVDVEFGRGQMLFALSQGNFSDDSAGSPALPNTGLTSRKAVPDLSTTAFYLFKSL